MEGWCGFVLKFEWFGEGVASWLHARKFLSLGRNGNGGSWFRMSEAKSESLLLVVLSGYDFVQCWVKF